MCWSPNAWAWARWPAGTLSPGRKQKPARGCHASKAYFPTMNWCRNSSDTRRHAWEVCDILLWNDNPWKWITKTSTSEHVHGFADPWPRRAAWWGSVPHLRTWSGSSFALTQQKWATAPVPASHQTRERHCAASIVVKEKWNTQELCGRTIKTWRCEEPGNAQSRPDSVCHRFPCLQKAHGPWTGSPRPLPSLTWTRPINRTT